MTNRLLPVWLSLALAVTGLYNASVNKPGALLTKEARLKYRVVAYAGKLSLVVLASPLLEKIVSDATLAAQVRLGVVTAGFVAGAWLRFFRNDNLPPRPSAKVE